MSHGLFCRCPWNIAFVLLSMEGLRALRFDQKYLNFCSKDERISYGFGMTWGWVINDRIFIFGWTNPLSWYLFLQYAICNYKDTYISIHISGQYCLFILRAHSSSTLNSQACYSRIDSVWVLMYLSFISCKKNHSESDSSDIVSLGLYCLLWCGLELFIFIVLFIVIWCEQAFTLKNKGSYWHLWFHDEPLTSMETFHWTKHSILFFFFFFWGGGGIINMFFTLRKKWFFLKTVLSNVLHGTLCHHVKTLFRFFLF